MKAYVLTTGALFGLLLLVHVWRVVKEGIGVAKDPFYIVVTVLAAVLCIWAWRVFGLIRRL
jgi:hypothetical protein